MNARYMREHLPTRDQICINDLFSLDKKLFSEDQGETFKMLSEKISFFKWICIPTKTA